MFKIRKDENGVSPVVGVILMVAITVILAAVIAAFVLGSSDIESTPQASIVVDNINTSAPEYRIVFTHQGGDTFYIDNIKLIITNNDALTQLTVDPLTTDSTLTMGAGDKLSFFVNGTNGNLNYGTDFTVGTTSGSLASWSVGDELQIQFVYKPSGNFIASLTIFA